MNLIVLIIILIFGLLFCKKMNKRAFIEGGKAGGADNDLFANVSSDTVRKILSEKLAEGKAITAKKPSIVFEDITESIKYIPGSRIPKPAVHIGQRKLHLSEVQFFTGAHAKEGICVYAGAAPSNHTGFLSRLFPDLKFILVDPNKFLVKDAKPQFLRKLPTNNRENCKILIETALGSKNKICIINDYFTREFAEELAELIPRFYFISDIRTNANEDYEPTSIDILWNMSQQFNWLTTMKKNVILAMLKWRHPFYSESDELFLKNAATEPYKTDFEISKKNGIDFVENYKSRKMTYLKGTINLQAFAGISSTETRLVTENKSIVDYGTSGDYEDRFFYYNNIERSRILHENKNADRALGFDKCNDCAIENVIWIAWLARYPETAKRIGARSVLDLVRMLSKNTKNLINGEHGRFFSQ